MNSGKISEKLINLALAIVGPIRGGLAHANVLVSMMFAGVSGAAQADTAGVGKILIPSMLRKGYDKETAVGVTAASSTIGVVIPPSIPMIIFAGLITGFFTATEAAAIASLYTAVVCMFYYKTLKWNDFPKILFDTLALSSLSLFALAAAGALGELMSYYQLGSMAQEFFANNVGAEWLFILIIIVFFLFIGTFMDAIPAMILFVPVILPTAIEFGIDPIHLGLIVVITLAVGLITPPYGLCLLLAAK